MATLTLTPSEARVGQAVTVEGLDFAVSTAVTVTVQSPNGNAGTFGAQITSDASGEIASTDIANYASGTFTLSQVPLAAETVVIDGRTYTFRATVATTANEILIGATASATLDNLKAAINLDPAGSGTLYGSATTVHATVRAGIKTATTLLIVAKVGGTGGNALATTETVVTGGSFGGGTLTGGAAASGLYDFSFTPVVAGPHLFTATDGVSSASATLKVYASG